MKIAIISAMEEELRPLLTEYKFAKIDTLNNQETYSYKGNNKEFLALTSGIGKVNAAITTTLLINKYDPDLIINIGTSGGVGENLEVCDFIVADKLVFHDVDVTGFNYQLGQLPGKETYFKIENVGTFKELVSKLDVNLKVGTVATGDVFVNKKEKSNFIVENFDNVLAVEMESTAVVMTAQSLGKEIFVLRTISDLANEESSISFDKYLDYVSQNFAKLVAILDE
jgi:adenosylhomocysteine nucleosidase